MSTEIGEPPVIDGDKVALVSMSGEVRVLGWPGAVSPPESQVEVTVLGDEHVIKGSVRDDGSFRVDVDGTIEDLFEVRAVHDGRRSETIIVVRGSAQVGEGDGGAPSCDQLSSIAYDKMQTAIAEADRDCETDDDCVIAPPDSACFAGCDFEYVSAAGLESVAQARVALAESLCADYEDSCGPLIEPPCLPPEPALCLFGQCQSGSSGGQVADGGAPESLCDLDGDIEWCASDISWRVTSGGTLPVLPSNEVFSLTSCDNFGRATPNSSCGSEAPRCASEASAGGTSVEKIYSILWSEPVRAAFMEGGTHGEPAETSGYVYEISVNSDTIIYNGCGPESDAACATRPLEQLIVELQALAQDSGCASDLDCTSDFEAGDCDAAIPVYWHDPQTGMCSPATYGGCGGNENRYTSFVNCEAACPPPEPSSCPPNRVLVEDVCVQCGLGGGCIDKTAACFRPCNENADCVDEKTADGTSLSCQDGMCWAPLVCL